MDWVGKLRVQRDVDKSDLVNNKTGLKGPHPKCMQINKETPTGQHGGESSHLFWAMSTLRYFSEVPVLQVQDPALTCRWSPTRKVGFFFWGTKVYQTSV